MAKVVGPLYSIGANGAIGNVLVYAKWKAVPYARKYVVPANPKTAAQQSQRSYISTGVAFWHSMLLTAADVSAWNAWALYMGAKMSGFNKYLSTIIKVFIATNQWSKFRNALFSNIGTTTALFSVCQKDNLADMTVEVYVGTSQGYMPYKGLATWNAGTSRYELSMTGLLTKVKYWVWFRMYKTGFDSTSGRYTFKTI